MEVNHEECVNYNKMNVCVRCKYFYFYGEDDPELEYLFFKKEK
jgi:hypothetical protein